MHGKPRGIQPLEIKIVGHKMMIKNLLITLALTFLGWNVANAVCTKEAFDEANINVFSKFPPELQYPACQSPCGYHVEAVLYVLNHGEYPEAGLNFFPESRALLGKDRVLTDVAISYLSNSDEPAVLYNGTVVSREDLLDLKGSVNLSNEELYEAYIDHSQVRLKINYDLGLANDEETVSNDSPIQAITLLKQAPENKPFVIHVVAEYAVPLPSGETSFSHVVPAMKVIEGGREKILIGLQLLSTVSIPLSTMQEFLIDFKDVLGSFVQGGDFTEITDLSILEPLNPSELAKINEAGTDTPKKECCIQ